MQNFHPLDEVQPLEQEAAINTGLKVCICDEDQHKRLLAYI